MIKNIQILVVDDETLVGEMTKELCEDFGYPCEYKTNSKEAMNYVQNFCTDIIILDIDLKESVTGIDLIPKFREINPNVIILMLTGEHNIKTGITAMKAGAFDYLLKPFNEEYLRERLKQAEETIHEQKLKTLILHAIVHDLRNPLNSLTLTLDAFKTFNQKNDETFFKYIDYAKKSCSQMDNMITNILAIEKMNKGRYILKNETFPLKPLLQETVTFFNDLNKEKPITFEAQLSDECCITCDKSLLLHILSNLLSNAQKYARTKCIYFKVENKENTFSFSVQNEAYIPPRDIKMIFEPFMQREEDVKPNLQNFGLGLSFCKTACTCMGGTIGVVSEEALRKTVFTFTIKDQQKT